MRDPVTSAVRRLSFRIFGTFNEEAWEATRRPPFASRASINALRSRHGMPALSEQEYEQGKAAYYERHPSARR